MSRTRSPGYPSIPLGQAIDLTKKLHDHDRTNPVDRVAAAKNIGYSGITGASAKVLADLAHYGLVERAGKGALRVTQLAVDILYPVSAADRHGALLTAATCPDLFAEIRGQFPDGIPSENALRSYLMRNSFASAAIPYAIKSYTETARLVEEDGGTESHGEPSAGVAESGQEAAEATSANQRKPAQEQQRQPRNDGQKVPLMEGERVIFMDEVGPGQYLKVIASGDLDSSLIEAMEDFTKRRRKRMTTQSASQEAQGDNDEGADRL